MRANQLASVRIGAMAGILAGVLALASSILSGIAATRMLGGILPVIAPLLLAPLSSSSECCAGWN